MLVIGGVSMTSRIVDRPATEIPAKQSPAPSFVERRRPGRVENVSPELIPLLRNPTVIIEQNPAEDDFRLPKGIAVGIVLAIPLWALIFLGVSLLIR